MCALHEELSGVWATSVAREQQRPLIVASVTSRIKAEIDDGQQDSA